MTVSIQNIRDVLDVPAQSVADAIITENITRSLEFVTNVQHVDTTAAVTDDAVQAMAAWLTYGSYMEGISQDLGAVSVADQVKLDFLRKVAELFIGQAAQQPIDLDNPVDNMKDTSIPIDPGVFTLTTSEGLG